MTPADVLRAAALLIDRGHCKDVSARDANGDPKHLNHPDACSWCATGAIYTAANPRNLTGEACIAMERHLGISSIVKWNDAPERTGPEVSAAMRAAADAWEREHGAEVQP